MTLALAIACGVLATFVFVLVLALCRAAKDD
jgi:hypothetical protein